MAPHYDIIIYGPSRELSDKGAWSPLTFGWLGSLGRSQAIGGKEVDGPQYKEVRYGM